MERVGILARQLFSTAPLGPLAGHGPHAPLAALPVAAASATSVALPERQLDDVQLLERSNQESDGGAAEELVEASLEEEEVAATGAAATTAVETQSQSSGSHALLRSVAYFLVHSWRTGGYAPWLLLLLAKYPMKTILALALREVLRRKVPAYSALAHQLMSFGSAAEAKFVRRQAVPYDTKKQYVISLHPHGVMICPWFNLLSRDCPDFHENLSLMDNLKVMLCIAPAVNLMPLHGELYRDRVTDASAATMKKILRTTDMSVAVCPGGFSEAIYTNADPVKEYCFIEGRMGFLKQAIENKVDVIPSYSFGANDMYHTVEWNRHKRAILAQKLSAPVFLWWGKYGTNLPYTEKVTTVTFDPFPASQYTPEQLEQCHADYKTYLKKCYDSYKHEAGSGHRELEFIGKSKPPEKYQRSKL